MSGREVVDLTFSISRPSGVFTVGGTVTCFEARYESGGHRTPRLVTWFGSGFGMKEGGYRIPCPVTRFGSGMKKGGYNPCPVTQIDGSGMKEGGHRTPVTAPDRCGVYGFGFPWPTSTSTAVGEPGRAIGWAAVFLLRRLRLSSQVATVPTITLMMM